MDSDFQRAFQKARDTQADAEHTSQELHRRADTIATECVGRLISAGREAYQVLVDAGAEVFAMSPPRAWKPGKPVPTFADAIGVVLASLHDEGPDHGLILLREGTPVTVSDVRPTRKQGMLSDKYRDMKINGRRVLRDYEPISINVIRHTATPYFHHSIRASMEESSGTPYVSIEIDLDSGDENVIELSSGKRWPMNATDYIANRTAERINGLKGS